jgi:hypothetical protein
MRITDKIGGNPASCEIFTDGETEDYTVNFGNAPVVMVKGNELKLDLYPNPAKSVLNIEVKSPAESVNIKIYNAIGQIINDFNLSGSKTTIDLSGYQKGLFFVGVDDGSRNMLKKFIKD